MLCVCVCAFRNKFKYWCILISVVFVLVDVARRGEEWRKERHINSYRLVSEREREE